LTVEGSVPQSGISHSAPRGAVFLSYASQDAEAAKKICDALRAAGVEVWFDAEGGLEHGDEWDAKIRRQIKECVLFLPVISANTQAREEGYFRIEWELAAQRALGIASGVAFILPVVVDATKEPDALVPDRFRSVQWTKLPGGVVPPDVLQRFLKLWSHRTGVLKHAAGSGVAGLGEAGPGSAIPDPVASSRKSSPAGLRYALMAFAGLVLGAGLYLALKPQRSPEEIAPPLSAAPTGAAEAAKTAAGTARDFPRDPDLRRARDLINSLDGIVEDFALAEDIVKPVVARRPNDPEVVTVQAEIAQEFLKRGYDNSQARRGQAQKLAERAVQLAPDNPFALAVLSSYLVFNSAQLSRAEELIRHAIALRPDEPRFHRTLYSLLFATKPAAETDAYGQRMAAQFPHDALVHYDIARRFKDANDVVAAEKWFDRTLEIKPVAFAMVWKAWFALWVHGDLPGMKAWLDRVPERQRGSTRVASARFLHALMSGETGPALRALNELNDEWLTDFEFTGPKALLMGNLALIDGRNDLARVQFEAALSAVAAEEARTPTDLRPQRAKLWVLIGLGRLEEARAIQRVLLQSHGRSYSITMRNVSWSNPIVSCLLLGFTDEAVALLKISAAESQTRVVLRNMFRLDPRLQPWRADPEIMALLAEPAEAQKTENRGQRPASASADLDDKSVAVLAFANLSDDKDNEYFSDGISEELLNVLAKIPGLKVTARTSAFHFKGKDTPIPEIAKQLGVAYVVEGSVRKQGTKVRITAQLIKAADGFHVWSDTFTRELKDIFAVQDEIAGLIAKNLELKMGMTSGPAHVINPEAYQEYLIGRGAVAKASMADLKEAVAHFERAVALEPKFTAAWVQLASAHTQLGRWGGAPTLESWQAARAAIDRARALEPDSPDVLLALGWILRTAEWNWRGAEQAFRRALELRPNHPDTLSGAAVLLFNVGKKEEAFRLGRQAVQLDPLNAATQIDLSLMFYSNENWPESEQAVRRALQLAPRGTGYHGILAWILVEQRRYEEAETEAALETGEIDQAMALGMLAIARGQGAAARAQLARFEALARTNGNSADLQTGIAMISANLGEKDYAFAALAKARASRDPSMSWLNNDWRLRPLHSDPRWNGLLLQIGLAEAQQK